MGYAQDTLEKVKKTIVKHKVKGIVNKKLFLEGLHDEKIDAISDKVIEKIGINNIIKAKKIIDQLNNK